MRNSRMATAAWLVEIIFLMIWMLRTHVLKQLWPEPKQCINAACAAFFNRNRGI